AGDVPSDPFSDVAEAPAEPAPTGAMQQMPADEGFFSDEPAAPRGTAATAPAQPAGNPFDPVDDLAAEAAAAGSGQAMAGQNPAQGAAPVEQFTPVEQPAAVEQFTPVEEFTPVATASEPGGFAEGATEPVPARPLPGNEFEPAAAQVQTFSEPVQQTVQHTASESFRPAAQGAAGGAVQLIAHEVRSNENYWSISRTHYGTPGYFQALALYNAARIPDPKKMRPGMKVLIPPAEALHARYPKLCPKNSVHAQAQLPPEQPVFFIGQDGTPRCRVSKSDTLSHISRRHLGRASRWLQVYELNRDQLKSPADLKAGMVLKLPADASRVQMAGNPAGSR
ncbi:MAG: LysM peptidoglycan-binding domain-containing protein, partial [Planctomycetaceae bacterium]|nr:LysM peptidoglycan-binding domain-containing protein [Planctomycetaceae bacterium]